jgi:hypothetical protein
MPWHLPLTYPFNLLRLLKLLFSCNSKGKGTKISLFTLSYSRKCILRVYITFGAIYEKYINCPSEESGVYISVCSFVVPAANGVKDDDDEYIVLIPSSIKHTLYVFVSLSLFCFRALRQNFAALFSSQTAPAEAKSTSLRDISSYVIQSCNEHPTVLMYLYTDETIWQSVADKDCE